MKMKMTKREREIYKVKSPKKKTRKIDIPYISIEDKIKYWLA